VGLIVCTYSFSWLDLVAVHYPQRDFRKIGRSDSKEKAGGDSIVEEKAPAEPWEKLKWFCNLWISNRHVSIPVAASDSYSKWKWLLEMLGLTRQGDILSTVCLTIFGWIELGPGQKRGKKFQFCKRL
jgi:hypothetical protein